MAILKHIASKSSNYGAALEYLIFKHDELRKTPILDQNGNRIMRDEFYLDGLNCEPYSFDAACQQLNREYQKNKNKDEIKSHHYIISFDPRDSTENCLTGKRAQELGLEYAKANFPGHQALVCTHMDGHNGSGNIHVHIVINSLRKLDVPKQPFMERPIDSKAGYKHHVTNEYLKHLQKSLMDLCRREFLHQIDLLSPSRTGVTEAEYWAQRRLDEKKQKIETEGFTPNPTKFQTQKQLIRDAVAAVREKAISYEDFQDILQDAAHWPEMRERNVGLLLWGGVGTGKSFMAGCIANALMEQEVAVCMTNFARIMNELNCKPAHPAGSLYCRPPGTVHRG